MHHKIILSLYICQDSLCASPFPKRPLFLILGKEDLSNLEDIKDAVSQRNLVKKIEIETSSGLKFQIETETQLSMIDAKMRGLLSGLGGAYWLLCTVDQDSACGRTELEIESYFEINRDIETTKDDYERLADQQGVVKRCRGDYSNRKGLTQEPVVDENLNMVSPLHSLMRSFSFALNLLYHLRAEIFVWTESSIWLGNSYRFLVQAQDDPRHLWKKKLELPWMQQILQEREVAPIRETCVKDSWQSIEKFWSIVSHRDSSLISGTFIFLFVQCCGHWQWFIRVSHNFPLFELNVAWVKKDWLLV